MCKSYEVGLQWSPAESGVEESKKTVCMLEMRRIQSKVTVEISGSPYQEAKGFGLES